MNKPKIVAIVKETKHENHRYGITLYSNSGSGAIRGVADNMPEFGLVENGYQFQFHGGSIGAGYFEVWFKFGEG